MEKAIGLMLAVIAVLAAIFQLKSVSELLQYSSLELYGLSYAVMSIAFRVRSYMRKK